MGLWLTGKRVNGNWAHADEDSSVYEMKAYVLNIFKRLGVPFGALVFGEEKNDIGGGFFMDDYVYRYALEEELA